MNLDDVADDEFHSRKTDPVRRQPPPPERRGRIGHVEHDLGMRLRHTLESEVTNLEWNCAVVNVTLFALRTRDCDGLAALKYRGRTASADNRRQAELAAHNGGVRRAPPVVRDDRCGALHDRHPVGIGSCRYQYCSL